MALASALLLSRAHERIPVWKRSDKGQDGEDALRNRGLAWAVRGWDWRL